MNDTHGVEGKGWYGFDLDGTLAKYDKWEGIGHIGEPVKPMVDLIKRMHDEGKVVKIVTARVAPRRLEDGTIGEQFTWLTREPSSDLAAKYTATRYIQDWCEEVAQLGFVPEIVYQKDHLMLELYDDRVKQVVPNEGLLVEDLYMDYRKMLRQVHADNGWLLAKLRSKLNGFWAGMCLGFILSVAVAAGIEAYNTWFGPEKEPARVRFEAAHKVLCDLVNDWPEDAR